jgi:hypothetical protein
MEKMIKKFELQFDLKPNGAVIRLNDERGCILRICGIPKNMVFQSSGEPREYIDIAYPQKKSIDINVPVNLTEHQLEVLNDVGDSKTYKADTRTLHVLEDKGLVMSVRYANGKFWEITDRGNAVVVNKLFTVTQPNQS